MAKKPAPKPSKESPKIAYMTDGHGRVDRYEKFFALAEQPGVIAAVIGGDVCQNFFLNLQLDFIQGYLIPRCAAYRKKTERQVFIILGNDDFPEMGQLLDAAESKGVLVHLHMALVPLEGYWFGGYPFINPTPFNFEHWEREEPRIHSDLAKFAKALDPAKADPKNLVMLFHAPPQSRSLDVLHNKRHVGSTGIRQFIDEHQPLLTLHGHIHESPDMSGQWLERFGRTVSINPGNAKPVLIDLAHPEKAKRYP